MNTNNINLQIAEKKGLEVRIESNSIFYRDSNNPSSWIPFDYTKDPALILELVLELGEKYWAYSYDGKYHCWHNKITYLDDMHKYKVIGDKDFGLATAMAWLEEFK